MNLKEALGKYKQAKKSKPGQGKRFKALKDVLAEKGAKNPSALAAYIGRKKYGVKKFGEMSH